MTYDFTPNISPPQKPWYKRAWAIVLLVVTGTVLLACCGITLLGAALSDATPSPRSLPSTLCPGYSVDDVGRVLCGSSAPTATTAVSGRSAAPTSTSTLPPTVITVEDGVWTVGVDIPVGTYKVIEPIKGDELCYWSITRTGTNGNDIVSNDLPSGGRPQVVLKKGQDFSTQGCGTWQKIK